MEIKKPPQKMKSIPRVKTLRSGSYKLIKGPGEAVRIKYNPRRGGESDDFSDTDWMLTLIDAGWEKAENAYYWGLDEGFAAGLKVGRSESKHAADNFRKTLTNLEENLIKYYSGVERWSVKLAMKIAEKVIAQAANEKRDLVEQTVRKAMAETADKSRILIKVNPSDYEALKEFKNNVTVIPEGIEHFKLETDPNITPGSCRIETPSGLLDADFTTQLGELRRALILQEEARE